MTALLKELPTHTVHVLYRPAPPLPNLYVSEEIATEVAAFIRTHMNALLQVSQDIALGKDSKLFFKVAAYLWLISFVGGLTDFLTLGYISKLQCVNMKKFGTLSHILNVKLTISIFIRDRSFNSPYSSSHL